MQIFREMSRPVQQNPAEREMSLRRSELVSDLFNNRGDAKDAADVKLRLSHAARKLTDALRGRVEGFLKENKALGKDLDQIDLPDGARGSPGQVAVRKMSMYLQWEKLSDPDVAAPTFEAVRSHGKDTEMREIFDQYDADRQRIQKERQQAAPNYYYMAFPETYSFN